MFEIGVIISLRVLGFFLGAYRISRSGACVEAVQPRNWDFGLMLEVPSCGWFGVAVGQGVLSSLFW